MNYLQIQRKFLNEKLLFFRSLLKVCNLCSGKAILC